MNKSTEKTDLRIIKTQESIKSAFMELMKEKPLEKISVVELARKARINKGTFYLHYADIYDLYDKMISDIMEEAFADTDFFGYFFSNPSVFLEHLGQAFGSTLPTMDLLSQGKMNLTNLPYTLDLLRRKIYETGKLHPSTQNDIRLDAIFSTLLVCTPRYEQSQAEIHQFVISLISLIFSAVE